MCAVARMPGAGFASRSRRTVISGGSSSRQLRLLQGRASRLGNAGDSGTSATLRPVDPLYTDIDMPW